MQRASTYLLLLFLFSFLSFFKTAHCRNATQPLCFAAVYFFLFFFSSAQDLRGLSADRCKTLPHDRKWV